jgi:hypothetical protein
MLMRPAASDEQSAGGPASFTDTGTTSVIAADMHAI